MMPLPDNPSGRAGPGIISDKIKNPRICQFWTCPDKKTEEFTFTNLMGQHQKVYMCFEHRSRVTSARARHPDMDVRISTEGWLWIDTFSYYLKHYNDKNT
jgi:hypothetical protein